MMPRVASKASPNDKSLENTTGGLTFDQRAALFGNRRNRTETAKERDQLVADIENCLAADLGRLANMPKMPLLSSKSGGLDPAMLAQTLMPRLSSKAQCTSVFWRLCCPRRTGAVSRCAFRVFRKSTNLVQVAVKLARQVAAHAAAWSPFQTTNQVAGASSNHWTDRLEYNDSATAETPTLPEFSALLPGHGASSNEQWYLAVLHTEARLRLGADYINQTKPHFDAGRPSPAHLDEQVEMEALRLHGHMPSQSLLSSYRAEVRALSPEQRAQFFFLRANDKLYRPDASLIGQPFTGQFYDLRKLDYAKGTRHAEVQKTSLEHVLTSLSYVILIASTSS
jgi:hypothetical protein